MKVSIVIITRDRLEDLRNTLNAYSKQSYPDKEIILIDNGSTDGTKQAIPIEFPEVKYWYLPYNFNIPAINIGVEMASGDIIWRCDDDSYPESNDALAESVEIFTKYPEIDIIATDDVEVKLGNVVVDWYPLKVDKSKMPPDGFVSNTFHGTGAAIRKKVFDKIGGFWEFGFEELDFSTRAILAGFNIRYFPSIRTLHFSSAGNRKSADRWIMISSQLIRYNCKYFPVWRALGRSYLFFIFQLLSGVLKRMPVLAILECAFSMKAAALGALRNERVNASREQLQQITLGVSSVSTFFNFFNQAIVNKVSKLLKK